MKKIKNGIVIRGLNGGNAIVTAEKNDKHLTNTPKWYRIGAGGGKKMTRLTITFNDAAYAMLENLHKETHKTKAEVLRTALTLLDYVEEKKKDKEILALVKDGEIKQEILIT